MQHKLHTRYLLNMCHLQVGKQSFGAKMSSVTGATANPVPTSTEPAEEDVIADNAGAAWGLVEELDTDNTIADKSRPEEEEAARFAANGTDPGDASDSESEDFCIISGKPFIYEFLEKNRPDSLTPVPNATSKQGSTRASKSCVSSSDLQWARDMIQGRFLSHIHALNGEHVSLKLAKNEEDAAQLAQDLQDFEGQATIMLYFKIWYVHTDGQVTI